MKSKAKVLNNQKLIFPDILLSPLISIILGSFFIAILAQISIPIPFSPVPITGQTIGVVIVGIMLGPWNGALAVVSYIFEGALGLPVFANFSSGIHVLTGPTAGYIWSFIIGAFLIGLLDRLGLTSNFILSFLSCLMVTTLILVFGALYLAIFQGSLGSALSLGFYPFLVGDFVKSFLSAFIIVGLKKFR
tara:strand:- start:161 stop:730 length:570 start_codon:yes stop_codon:yes gene_type:complete